MRATADHATQTPNELTRGANRSEHREVRAPLDIDRAVHSDESLANRNRTSRATLHCRRTRRGCGFCNAIGDELLTVHDAAHFLNVSVSSVYEHTRDDTEDRLPFEKLGSTSAFDRTDLRAYVDTKRAASRRQPRRR